MTQPKSILVVTGGRAEYGLLTPIMRRINQAPDLELRVAVTGMHLSPEFGLTWRDIEADGFVIDRKIETLMSSDSSVGVAKSTGLGVMGFAEYFADRRPDMVVLLGDRYETFAACTAAFLAGIPIAHLHGGEATFGALDEGLRHAVTKMSWLHFTSTEAYRRRVIQLGEDPARVFWVGSTGVETIRAFDPLSREELARDLGVPLNEPYLLATFHPATAETADALDQFEQLLTTLDRLRPGRILFTLANADAMGRSLNRRLLRFVADHPDWTSAHAALGARRYLSALRYALAVVGNSSSGIIEAPSLGVPTVNIGQRQAGRVRAESVVDCTADSRAIQNALERVLTPEFKRLAQNIRNPYDRLGTSDRIVDVLRAFDPSEAGPKRFYDLAWSEALAAADPSES